MSITTLDQIKKWLKHDDDTPDDALKLAHLGAEAKVKRYITDEFEDGQYPDDIQLAVAILSGFFVLYSNAEAEAPKNGNFLPLPVMSLLYDYRRPTAE